MTTVEAKMIWREARRKVKARIKELAVTQREVKRARKSTYGQNRRMALAKKLGSTHPEWFSPQSDVITRKTTITATLNYYNELRGKSYRHKIKNQWYYDKKFAALVKEFGDLEALTNRV
jgi:hypothetical protein